MDSFAHDLAAYTAQTRMAADEAARQRERRETLSRTRSQGVAQLMLSRGVPGRPVYRCMTETIHRLRRRFTFWCLGRGWVVQPASAVRDAEHDGLVVVEDGRTYCVPYGPLDAPGPRDVTNLCPEPTSVLVKNEELTAFVAERSLYGGWSYQVLLDYVGTTGEVT